MTPEEAIKSLQNIVEYWTYKPTEVEAAKMAIAALEEIQQYRAIGTVDECREAVEKQKPKKPIPINYQDYADKIDNAEFFEGSYFCPNCGEMVGIDENVDKFCRECGQAIDTENLEGMEDENT